MKSPVTVRIPGFAAEAALEGSSGRHKTTVAEANHASGRIIAALLDRDSDTPTDRIADCVEACRQLGMGATECGRRCNPTLGSTYQCKMQDNSVEQRCVSSVCGRGRAPASSTASFWSPNFQVSDRSWTKRAPGCATSLATRCARPVRRRLSACETSGRFSNHQLLTTTGITSVGRDPQERGQQCPCRAFLLLIAVSFHRSRPFLSSPGRDASHVPKIALQRRVIPNFAVSRANATVWHAGLQQLHRRLLLLKRP